MIHSRNLPFLTTLTIFVVAYLLCVMQYPAIFSTRVIGNLLTCLLYTSPSPRDS